MSEAVPLIIAKTWWYQIHMKNTWCLKTFLIDLSLDFDNHHYPNQRRNPNFIWWGKVNIGKMIRPEAVAQRCSIKKVFLKFSKLTGRNLWWSPFFDKAAGIILELYLKRESLWHRCFPVTFSEKSTFYTKHWWLLL